jgi:hypothetical protein
MPARLRHLKPVFYLFRKFGNRDVGISMGFMFADYTPANIVHAPDQGCKSPGFPERVSPVPDVEQQRR